jgi:hypothetical protein
MPRFHALIDLLDRMTADQRQELPSELDEAAWRLSLNDELARRLAEVDTGRGDPGGGDR